MSLGTEKMKNKYTIFGIILIILGLAFIAVALANPQLSFPWSNWVSYTLYGFYAIYTILVFCMSKMKNPSIAGCVILAFQFAALGLVIISVGIRNTPDDYNWYLPVGLGISVLTQFANLYVTKKRKKKNEHE